MRERRLAGFVVVAIIGTITLVLVEDGAARLGVTAAHLQLRSPQRAFELVAWALLAAGIAAASSERSDQRRLAPTGLLTVGASAVLMVGILLRASAGASVLRPLGALAAVGGVALLRGLGRRGAERVLLVALGAVVVGSLLAMPIEGATVAGAGRLTVGQLQYARLRGIFPWPIALGTAAGFLLLVAAQSMSTGAVRRRWGSPVVLLAAVTIVAADALTAAIGVVAALLVRSVAAFLLVRAPRMADRVAGRGAPLVAVLGAFVTFLAPFVVARPEVPLSLTGRADLWRRILDAVPASDLLLGLGFQPLNGERTLRSTLDLAWAPGHTHSTPFELVLSAGVLGATAFTLLATAMLLAALRTIGISRGWSLAPVVLLLAAWSTEEYLIDLEPADQLLLLAPLLLLFGWLRESGGSPSGPNYAQPHIHAGDIPSASPREGE